MPKTSESEYSTKGIQNLHDDVIEGTQPLVCSDDIPKTEMITTQAFPQRLSCSVMPQRQSNKILSSLKQSVNILRVLRDFRQEDDLVFSGCLNNIWI